MNTSAASEFWGGEVRVILQLTLLVELLTFHLVHLLIADPSHPYPHCRIGKGSLMEHLLVQKPKDLWLASEAVHNNVAPLPLSSLP
ncbi:hypothetical protein RHGRI_031493 [Rhododendron griersonianum]|uniref:Secreted protein n=1 Tax=Rhododendron griersonianum TaxID=479676 RepID=A0AAV6IAN5_9ERIC|nr:hypothetical protein RHGRI_031493 [Rhododendron griersonianum]